MAKLLVIFISIVILRNELNSKLVSLKQGSKVKHTNDSSILNIY